MSYSYTISETFTLSHARRLAAKVVADMRQCQQFYGSPSDSQIENYQQELTVLLSGGYVQSYEFGFKTTDDRRVVSWKYTVGPAGDLEGGRSGGLYATADIAGARSFNFLSYSDAWIALSADDKAKIKNEHPVRRSDGEPPQDGNGHWDTSRHYTSGGVAVTRKEFRPW